MSLEFPANRRNFLLGGLGLVIAANSPQRVKAKTFSFRSKSSESIYEQAQEENRRFRLGFHPGQLQFMLNEARDFGFSPAEHWDNLIDIVLDGRANKMGIINKIRADRED